MNSYSRLITQIRRNWFWQGNWKLWRWRL